MTENSKEIIHHPKYTSIHTAEAFGILKAVKSIEEDTTNNSYLICTDSLSTLTNINKCYPTSPIIQNIRETIHQISQSQTKIIKLQWIPSHVGIRGNEQADAAAKEAPEMEILEIPISPSDLIAYIKQELKNNGMKPGKERQIPIN